MTTAILLAAAEEHNPVFPKPAEIVLGLIAFGILVFVLWKFAVPKFEEAYAKRTEEIEGGIRKAEQAQAEAERARQQYTAQLAEAHSEAAKIRDDARLEAERIREEARAEAQAEAERIVAAGKAQLEAQRQQVIAELRAEYGRNAVELASRIVGEALEDETRRRRTVERFLAELDAQGARN
ncbi:MULTISPECIES: F0F1 ATP synthase subunit B [Thermocrispum]|jgi:F-type H+-transporting ATPase subunit b|uniref:ATP synthase subunit b n=1 Tax=Thermocrispum agreste TaxID=37925 RepID=A0A2W4JL47_9PSEU|nr:MULTISPECIES: F0F1 ATP synthase subunit B [Thermocrispum]PZM99872.1 MAG: F0F1 ATP synthase subunit B [Thermocrispum agreste]